MLLPAVLLLLVVLLLLALLLLLAVLLLLHAFGQDMCDQLHLTALSAAASAGLMSQFYALSMMDRA